MGKEHKVKKKHADGTKQDTVELSLAADAVKETEVSTGDAGAAELDKARQEAAENYDKYLRLAAEFENYKKRAQRERTDLLNYGTESLIRDILPTLDGLERAVDHSEKSGDFTTFVEGLKLIHGNLLAALKKNGVEHITAQGETFDPHYHEAMMTVETGQYPSNTVVDEYEKGYLLNGRLLRPSKVSVAKTLQNTEDNETDET